MHRQNQNPYQQQDQSQQFMSQEQRISRTEHTVSRQVTQQRGQCWIVLPTLLLWDIAHQFFRRFVGQFFFLVLVFCDMGRFLWISIFEIQFFWLWFLYGENEFSHLWNQRKSPEWKSEEKEKSAIRLRDGDQSDDEMKIFVWNEKKKFNLKKTVIQAPLRITLTKWIRTPKVLKIGLMCVS